MDEKLVKQIAEKMKEKNNDELLKIFKENNKWEWSEEAFEAIRRVLAARGESLPIQSEEEGRKEALNNEAELRKVIFAGGITRKALNITALIGLFVFGWLMAFIFEYLGKAKQGWRYVIVIISALMIGRLFAPPIGVLALIIYIISWIHANLLLSRYKRLATERMAELETRGENNVNTEIEKGLILCRVLKDKKGVDILGRTLQMAGGDASLLNLAGVIMSDNKRYKEAAEFFDCALAGTNNEVLIKQLKQNRAYADKKMAKQRNVS